MEGIVMGLSKRMKLAGVAAAVLAAVALTPGAASASSYNNDDATIDGVTPVDAATHDCPSGNLCLYTGYGFYGKMFKLYYCRIYTLRQWNGLGSFRNRNTGNAMAQFLDMHGDVSVRSTPKVYPQDEDFDFTVIW